MSEREQHLPGPEQIKRAQVVAAKHPGVALELQGPESLLILKGPADGYGVSRVISALAVRNSVQQKKPDLFLNVYTRADDGKSHDTKFLARHDGESYKELEHLEGLVLEADEVLSDVQAGTELFAAYTQLPPHVQRAVPSSKVFDVPASPASSDANELLEVLQDSLRDLSIHHAAQTD